MSLFPAGLRHPLSAVVFRHSEEMVKRERESYGSNVSEAIKNVRPPLKPGEV